MSAKIAAIGDIISIMPFRAFGVDTYNMKIEDMDEEALEEIIQKNYRIIYITERLAEKVMSKIEEYDIDPAVSITLIPDSKGDIGLSRKKLRQMVIRAIGADTLSDSDKDTMNNN